MAARGSTIRSEIGPPRPGISIVRACSANSSGGNTPRPSRRARRVSSGRERVHGWQLGERRLEQLVEGTGLCENVVVGHGHRGVCLGRVPGGTTSIDCPRSTGPPLGCAGGGR